MLERNRNETVAETESIFQSKSEPEMGQGGKGQAAG